MTTIAWDGRTLAADTQVSRHGNDVARTVKIHKFGRLLVGACGTTSLNQRFIGWLAAGMHGDPPALAIGDSRGCVIAIMPDGAIVEWNGDHPPDVVRARFAAWGSGSDVALGAMAFGASAEQAVLAASTLDHATGGPITTLAVGPK